MIDEFLYTRPQSQTLQLLFSTRDARKSQDTQERLHAHFQRTLKAANARTPGVSLLLESRIKLEPVLVDLLKLDSVKTLAEQLLTRGQSLDAVVWNAGIAGWTGLNWPKAILHVTFDLLHATTYPRYMNAHVGLLSKPQEQQAQQPSPSKAKSRSEPQLGQVFTANVFGHYMLTHWLRPLMHSDTRIVWISSISAVPDTFSVEDLQGLHTVTAYEGSKRLTDYLVLTADLPSTRSYVQAFLPAASEGNDKLTSSRPKMYLTHPGVVGTNIADLIWPMNLLMLAAFWFARVIGSPWHLVLPYRGAVSAVHAVLSPPDQLPETEALEGKGKWGAATDVFGHERVARTEVEGWGFCGQVDVVPPGSITAKTGRYRGHKPTTNEDRENFDDTGRRIWRELEHMRVDWEKRLGNVQMPSAPAVDV